ncbi:MULTISPECIES: glutathione synthase [Rhodanobacter]|uniref:Glutathione synthetase n=1 Tax=Rhodanobacter denitrificans TaxID=666685 RepID=I4WZ33_9GAMM|nr:MULTISPECIES: glutathione synthase [Rhodanobacter]AGG88022.1 glutathione synthetase [Rhodanobacter denitrificans]EIM04725.1 glutathione synthetase [Rhodanobacter denitrificans]KZC20536.1 glutathione synthase [Rhodanobacter denitrificans]UJJ52831.1 glutathione synthase [Rhodanobacter denitrificans]UJJ60283.1 glutathione synthase [Rhodanobacter denitrificans]
MTLSVGVLMDPIGAIKAAKDTSFAMLLEARRRGHSLHYFEQGDLALRDGEPWARIAPLDVREDPQRWYTLGPASWRDLRELDVVLMRKDPPVNAQFIYDTMVLQAAQRGGVAVVNDPRSLRDCNEKLFSLEFPQCIVPTMVSRDAGELRRFTAEHGEVVLKPLDGMGGRGIFRARTGDGNLNSMLETLLGGDAHGEGRQFTVAQRYIPQISAGDKRILVIDGEPVPYALARIPQGDEFRGNLAAGGRGVGVPLSERDRWIVSQVAPELRRRGLLFVGLDVIGDYLTEINVTSPTCVRELDAQFGLNIAGQLFDVIEQHVTGNRRA